MLRYHSVQQELRSRPKRWLVTGAAGFIGSSLVETLLGLGQKVQGFDNFATGHRRNLDDAVASAGEEAAGRFTFDEGDIRDLDACRSVCRHVDVVLHQAALGSVPRSIEDPLTSHEVNASGTLNMLVAARDAGVCRFVFASSSSVYGDDPSLPKREDCIGAPLSPYAISKRTDEMYALNFQRLYGLEVIGLRYFNVFGKRQDPQGPYAAVIPRWIATLLEGRRCVINGDGLTSRDFCYIRNTVQANLLAAMAGADATGRMYNVAVGQRTTLNDLHGLLVELLQQSLGRVIPVDAEYSPFRPGDIRHSEADITEASSRLGYEPTHTLRQGLEEALAWYVRDATQPAEQSR